MENAAATVPWMAVKKTAVSATNATVMTAIPIAKTAPETIVTVTTALQKKPTIAEDVTSLQ